MTKYGDDWGLFRRSWPSKRPQKSGLPVFSTLSHLVDHEQKLSPKELRPTGDRTLSRVRVYRPRLREMPAPARAEEGGEEGQDAAARGGTKRPVAPARRGCTSHAHLRLGARRLQLTPEQGITLRGSAGIVAEIFSFGINGTLYQRGIYPSEPFTRVQKYGLTVLVTTDLELIKYLNNVVEQLKDWSYRCSVPKLVVVISDIESGEVLERWQFAMECDKTVKDDSAPREKSEIRSVIRQITATVTFPPLLEVSCLFDLHIYTDKDLVVPEKWEESGPQFITNSEEVRLCSFTATIHKVNSVVAYKIPVNN
ncbi:LOW QUALITY PROTEIN: mitotic spindle assembly checkpoint protein MAD2A-like [Dugong dugon]